MRYDRARQISGIIVRAFAADGTEGAASANVVGMMTAMDGYYGGHYGDEEKDEDEGGHEE